MYLKLSVNFVRSDRIRVFQRSDTDPVFINVRIRFILEGWIQVISTRIWNPGFKGLFYAPCYL